MEPKILTRLTCLGHPGRMAVFRLLSRRYPDEVPAGEIARALDLKPNTLSVYLSALVQEGLATQSRQGTSLRYRVQWGAVHDIIDYLYLDCCRGRPDLCTHIAHRDIPEARGKLNVLFICSGNSARSIFAEALLRGQADDRFNVYSAGTNPQSQLNPVAVEMLLAKGHDVTPLRAKHVSEFQTAGAPVMDFVFTVCDQAANEDCPAWPGQPITAHWGVPDPVKATGTEAEKRLAFQQAYGLLKNRIRAFAALPFQTLDVVSLQRRVDAISTEETAK